MEAHESADIMCVEVQIDSVASPEREEKSLLLNSTKKRSKRKYQDNELRDKTPKKLRSVDSNKNLSHCDSSDDGSKHRTKKVKERTRTRRNNVDIDPAELKNVLDGMDDEINDVLEETAEKNRLTAANVKNILRHVITNEYVLAMVRNTMKAENDDGDLEEAVFEPKLTRSKVKELREKQQILPWPMSTPVKQPESATKALLEEEFPDESSSDEDYKPNEEECPSEEDNLVGSPKSADLDSNFCRKHVSPAPNTTEENADADDEIGLVIALPEPEPGPVPHEYENTEVDKIALRTRSKLPLKDTPLEVIEASFVAPDISEDMYDTHCDDEEWQKFLQEYRALDTIVAVENVDEEPDNAEDDPEYNVLEDDDIPDELDLRYDNNVKVTRKELNALIAEMLETAQVELNDGENDADIDEDEEDTEPVPRIETPIMDVAEDFVENVRTQWMTNEERLRLEEQMRMYVQILTQSYLLSFGIPELNYINVSCKLFLDEIKMFASLPSAVNDRSAFCAHNLDGALEIVNYYENNKEKIHLRANNSCANKQLPGIHSIQVKKTLYNSPVFMYPDMLPVCGFYKAAETKKPVFTNAEDNLIAIGLEEFSFSTHPVYFIQTLLMPPKTEYQIKLRIKNSKATKRTPNNPIKYFYQHGKAPPFPRTVRPFDPSDVKAPKDYPAEMLPKWMWTFCAPVIIPTSSAPILPKPPKPSITIKKRTFNHKIFVKPTYRVLLPRGNHFSPLKQISPILKKYNQKRRAHSGLSPLAPLGTTSRVRNTAGVYKRPAIKPLISPKSVVINEKIVQGSITETTNVHSAIISNNHESETGHSDSILMNCEKTVQGTNGNGTAYLVNAETSSASEFTPDLNANECDIPVESEAVDDGDEEIIDDEHESTHQDLIMTNNMINKKQSANKKKNKQQRDLESSLALLQPNLVENDPKREERETLFANSYLLRVTEALKEDVDTQEKFLKTLCKYQHNAKSPVKIYLEIKDILKDYPALAEDFVAFLRPEQAKDCGKYKEYLTLCKIRAFIRKIEVHFSNQPQHLLKILRTLAQFKQQASISSVEVLSTLQPLLKNQSHLIEELTNLLPDMAPPESLMTDFQEVTIPNSDDDNSSVDSCEEIQIPESTDPYGGKDCPCDCHTSSTEVKVVNKTRHCVKCGVKFMDGKIYIQTGKVLKPAQVVYREVPPEPSKVSSDTKTIAKSKTNCSPSAKTSVVTEQGSKSEVPQAKKDPVKTPSVVQQPPVLPEEPVPSTSKLPCDVFEDTVFPAGVHVSQSKKSVPSDFSQLKEVMGQTNDKDAASNGRPSDNSTEAPNSTEQVNQSQTSVAQQKDKWSRDEDKLIIYNCQRFGITEKAFQASSSSLKSRTSEEVQGRFMHLMNLLSKELKI